MIDPQVLQSVSMPLAIEDAVPVALSTAGFLVVARGVGARLGDRAGRVATVAAVVIGLGGAAKVSWKLLAAGFERDVVWLDALLFPLLSVGFVGMLLLVRAARRPSPWAASQVEYARGAMAGLAVLLAVLFASASVETVGPLLLPVAVTASLLTSWLLWSIARQGDDRLAAGLIAANVVATLSLAGLARVEQQTLGLQWVEQSINTASQALFLWAAMRISTAGFPWLRNPAPASVEALADAHNHTAPLDGALGNR